MRWTYIMAEIDDQHLTILIHNESANPLRKLLFYDSFYTDTLVLFQLKKHTQNTPLAETIITIICLFN